MNTFLILSLVHEHLPDIIVECESQLDQPYSSTTKVFPARYYVLRKDHCDGVGGVFMC